MVDYEDTSIQSFFSASSYSRQQPLTQEESNFNFAYGIVKIDIQGKFEVIDVDGYLQIKLQKVDFKTQ